MKEYLRCKVCNYIMDKEGSPDKCPACGVPETAFEDYKYNISNRRRIIMELDIHPIVLHFPQAISVLIPLLVILNYFTSPVLTGKLYSTIEVLGCILPVSVIAAIFTGIFDGHNRFRKTNTPHLIKKTILGSLLAIISFSIAALIIIRGLNNSVVEVAALSTTAVLLQIILARIGIKLMFAYTPGK